MFLELEKRSGLFDPGPVGYPYHGFISTLYSQTDTVLRFFAGSVLRILHASGVNADTFLTHDNTEAWSLFFTCLQAFPEDWAQAFHFYMREHGCLSPGNMRRNGTTTTPGIPQSTCHSIKSIRIDGRTYTDGFMLATITTDTLALIIPVKIASQQHFDLIEVPLKHILNSGLDSMYKIRVQESRLQLHIDANGVILKNGELQKPQNLKICLVSEEDLTDLWTGTKNISYSQNQATKRLVGRRRSSIIIPLDTGDEVAEKTFQYETEPDVTAGDSRPQRPAQTQNDPALTPQVAKSNSVVEPTVNHGTHDAEPRDSRAEKAGIEVSQSGQKKDRTSFKKKTGLPSNTQEPLQLSRLRNAKRKVYTPNDEVDWDEDLRPTDDSQETDEKDADFTSISSPLPSGSPALKRRAGATKKKRKSDANSKAGSSKKPVKKSKPKTGKSKTKVKSKSSRLPLLPRSSADNESRNGVSAQNIKECLGKDDKNIHDPTRNGDGNDVEKRPGKTLEFQACHTLPIRSVSSYRSEDALVNGEDFDPFKNLDLVSEASAFPENLWDSSTAWLTQVDGNWNGDARDFPEENKLDWETDAHKKVKPKGQTKSHEGTGKTLGKKLAAALLDAGILSDDPPSEEDRSSRHHILVGESKQYKRSEVSNPHQEVQSPMQRSDQQSTPEARGRLATRQIESKEPDIDVLSAISPVVTALEEHCPGERSSVAIDGANTCSNKFAKAKVSASSISRKRAASQERKCEKRSKKHQADPDPEYQPSEPNGPSQLPQRNIQSSKEADTFDQGYLDMETSSWVTTEYGDSTGDAENTQLELHLHPPRADLERSTTSSSPRTPVRNKYTKRKQRSLPKAIVDENGSPRLRIRQSPDSQQRFGPMGKWHGQLGGQRRWVEQERGNRVCDSDSDTEDYPSKICTFRSRVHLHFGEDLLGAKGKGPGDTKSEDSTSIASVEQPLSTALGLGGFPAETLHGDDSPIAISTSATSSEEEMETGIEQTRRGYELVASQSPLVANPVQLESELAGLNGRIDGDDMATKWQTTLQAIQQTTDDVLANTSKSLMHHVQREQGTINRVLELYLEGCHRILEQLGKAQEERIAVYRQQMNSIKEHQADLCRDFVRRLEGNK
ncbi:hypothetical protein PHISCL_08686 [Aspergillus sclerotialis]|uniref:Uncharacterized protein n=1 Tax=Aspergillus sclerotialis TaxID=2070753 RepID=A0A3A2Z797_9EURO|nr:hypothetical protein PHISCL_08686 [Aspergillus sclerotialis]